MSEQRSEAKRRDYTINLGRVYWGRRTNRAARAVRYIRSFVARHFGVEEDKVKIDNDVNEFVWSRSIEKPPRRVRVRAILDPETGIVRVRLLES